MKILPFPDVIFATSSVISGDIKVLSDGRDRRLVVAGIVQSVSRGLPDLENKVWAKLLDFTYSINPNPKVLLLGLGGGTTAHLASKKFNPQSINVVEIDGAIIDVAKRFFDVSEIPNLHIEKADAVEYAGRKTKDLFDLIVVDIYLGQTFPIEAEKAEFYKNLKNKLAGAGVVSINRIFYDHESESRAAFVRVLKEIFGTVAEIVMPGMTSMKNYLYFAHV